MCVPGPIPEDNSSEEKDLCDFLQIIAHSLNGNGVSGDVNSNCFASIKRLKENTNLYFLSISLFSTALVLHFHLNMSSIFSLNTLQHHFVTSHNNMIIITLSLFLIIPVFQCVQLVFCRKKHTSSFSHLLLLK